MSRVVHISALRRRLVLPALVAFAASSAVAIARAQEDTDELAPASDGPVIVPPRLESVPEPEAPEGLEASVEIVVTVVVDEEGRVVEATPESDHLLAERAREIALEARFSPATVDGEPVPTRVQIAVRFEVAPPPVEDAPTGHGETNDARPPVATSPREEPIEVVVTGARFDQDASRSAVRVEVISRRELEEGGIRNAAEALEEAHGVQVNRTFRGMELWIRGLDPEYSLILVDGATLPGRVGGAIDLSRFGVEEIERIEIVRGPSSALYGSEAIGGVVNILTREPRHDFRASAQGTYGSRNTADAVARVEGRLHEKVFLGLNGGFHHEDPFRQEPASVATSGSRRVQGTVGGRLDARFGDHRLSARASYLYLRLEGVEASTVGAVIDRTQLQEQGQISVEHRFDKRARAQLVQRLTYTQYREQTLLDQRGATQLDQLEDHREHLAQYTGIVRIPFSEAHDLTLGVEPMVQTLESPRLPEQGERIRLGVFAQYDGTVWEPTWGRLRLVPALRADVDSQFGSQISPKLAARFDVSDTVVFRASYGRGFRAPSFQQLLLRFENPTVGYIVLGNPDLDAERSHGVDAGFTIEPVDRLTFGATFFRNDLQHMIAVVSAPPDPIYGQIFTYDNLESAWTMGAEADATVRVMEGLGLKLGYMFVETWDGENDRRLEGRPRHRLTASLRGEIEKAELVFTARAAFLMGRTYYPTTVSGEVTEVNPGAIAQIDLRVEKRFGEKLALFFGVENLADAGDAYLMLRPRTFYGGVGTQLTKGGDREESP